jgi:Leucine-rich repeat (LRR) protein
MDPPNPRVAAGDAPVYITEKLIRRACGGTQQSLARIERLVLKGGVTIRGTLRRIDFGACTRRLQSLRHLDLSDNDIIRIEQLEQFAGVLRELSLANNRLSRATNLSPLASSLEMLNLNGNHITRIPESIAELRRLRVLGLAANRLGMLDDFRVLAKLPALAQLEVSGWTSVALSGTVAQVGRPAPPPPPPSPLSIDTCRVWVLPRWFV